MAPTSASAEREAKTQSREQQGGDEGAGDADENIAKQAETRAFDQDARKPAGDRADRERYEYSQ